MLKKERKKARYLIYLAKYTILIYLFTTLAFNEDFHSRNNIIQVCLFINEFWRIGGKSKFPLQMNEFIIELLLMILVEDSIQKKDVKYQN